MKKGINKPIRINPDILANAIPSTLFLAKVTINKNGIKQTIAANTESTINKTAPRSDR